MHLQVANRFCVAITKVERWHRAPATYPMPLPPTSTTVPPAEISRVAPVAVSTTVTGPPSAVRNTANRPASANWTTPSGARGSEASYSATSLEPSTKLAVAPSEYASSRGPLRPAPCRTRAGRHHAQRQQGAYSGIAAPPPQGRPPMPGHEPWITHRFSQLHRRNRGHRLGAIKSASIPGSSVSTATGMRHREPRPGRPAPSTPRRRCGHPPARTRQSDASTTHRSGTAP